MIEIKNKNLLLTAIQILEIRYISFERLISLPYQRTMILNAPKSFLHRATPSHQTHF